MQCNVGGVDRTIRFVVGTVIMAAGAYFQSWWGLLGLVVFLTALFSRCPAYIPFGVSTCRVASAPSTETAPPEQQ